MGKVKVYVLPQGNIQVFVDEATDEEATRPHKTGLCHPQGCRHAV